MCRAPVARGIDLPARDRRAAFTLIEMLVVVAIIGLLAILVMPAVQRVRESSRRNTCAGNLKQVALAIGMFDAAQGALPAGYTVTGTAGNAMTDPAWGWAVFILPHLEQQILYDQLDPLSRDLKTVLTSSGSTLLQTSLPVYLCPSDNVKTLNTQCGFGNTAASTFALATANYVGSAGGWAASGNVCVSNSATVTTGSTITTTGSDWIVSTGTTCCWLTRDSYCAPMIQIGSPFGTNSPRQVDTGGVFLSAATMRVNPASLRGRGPRGLPASAIKDGESEVIVVGERPWDSFAAVWAGAGRADSFINEGTARTLARPMLTGNVLGGPPSFWVSSGQPYNQGKWFSYIHPGGVQFAFCDGSVRFLANDASTQTIITNLTNRCDGNVVDPTGNY